MASFREYIPRATRIDARPQGRSGYTPGAYSLTKAGEPTGLQQIYAMQQRNPLTGMRMQPSSFDTWNRSNQMAKAGEWEAKALHDQYYGGNPEQQQQAGQGIEDFRAMRTARGMYGNPSASPLPQQGMTNPYPVKPAFGGFPNDIQKQREAAFSVGGNGAEIPAPQQRTPALDTGSMYGAPVAGETRRIDAGGSGGGSSVFVPREQNYGSAQLRNQTDYLKRYNPYDSRVDWGKQQGINARTDDEILEKAGGDASLAARLMDQRAMGRRAYLEASDLKAETPYGPGGGIIASPPKTPSTNFTPDPQALADMRARRSSLRLAASPIQGPQQGPPPGTIQGLSNPYLSPVAQASRPAAVTPSAEQDIASLPDTGKQLYLQQRIKQLQDESQSGISRLGGRIASAGLNFGNRAASKIADSMNYATLLPRGLGAIIGNEYRRQNPRIQVAKNFLYGDQAKKSELAKLQALLK